MTLKSTEELFKQTYQSWNEHKAPRLGAALSYYTVFSLAPLLLLVISLAAYFFHNAHARDQVVNELQGIMGTAVAGAAKQMVGQAAKKPGSGMLARIIGIVTLLAGASGVFGQLQDSLNTVWEVAPKPGRGILATLKDRFLSYTMVLGSCFLLLVSLILSSVLASAGKFAGGILHMGPLLGKVIDFGISFVVVAAMFALIFKVLPDAKIEWGDVWVGALLTALLFTIGKFILDIYLAKSSPGSAYGAAGSLVALLLWVYYAAQIMLFGAEFTRAYADKYGSHVVPAADAVGVTPEAQARQGMPDPSLLDAAARSGHSPEKPEARKTEPTKSGESKGNPSTTAVRADGRGAHSHDGVSSDSRQVAADGPDSKTPVVGRRETTGRPTGQRETRGQDGRGPASRPADYEMDDALPRARRIAPIHPVREEKKAAREQQRQESKRSRSDAMDGSVLVIPDLMQTTASRFSEVTGYQARPASAEPERNHPAPPAAASPAPDEGLAGMTEALNDARTRHNRAVVIGAAAGMARALLKKRG